MTDYSHTPGPWAYDVESEAVFRNDSDVCPNIAFLSDNADDPTRNLADGTLMAAAPDLLATLVWLRANYADGRTVEINALIDAAIAKATA